MVSVYGSSKERCSTRRLQQPTVSASSYASSPAMEPTSDFSLPTLNASLSIIQIAVANWRSFILSLWRSFSTSLRMVRMTPFKRRAYSLTSTTESYDFILLHIIFASQKGSAIHANILPEVIDIISPVCDPRSIRLVHQGIPVMARHGTWRHGHIRVHIQGDLLGNYAHLSIKREDWSHFDTTHLWMQTSSAEERGRFRDIVACLLKISVN